MKVTHNIVYRNLKKKCNSFEAMNNYLKDLLNEAHENGIEDSKRLRELDEKYEIEKAKNDNLRNTNSVLVSLTICLTIVIVSYLLRDILG